MFNWFSRACIVWPVHASSLFVNTTISMAALPEVLALMFLQLQTLLPALSDSCLVDKKRESLLRDAEVPGNDTTCQKWWKPETASESAASRDHPGRNSSQYDTVFVREHEHVHHGHSHAHSHLHSAPDSISSVGEYCSVHVASQLWPSSGFRCFGLNKGAIICTS